MGFPPAAVRVMSLWHYMAALEGWQKANESEDADRLLSEDEEDELFAALAEPPVWMN